MDNLQFVSTLTIQVLEPGKQSPDPLSDSSPISLIMTGKKKEKKTSIKDIEPKLREKKEMPGVGELLTYGSNYGKERTWLDILSGPIILFILFLLTLQIFLYVRPHIGKNKLPVVHSRIPDMQQHTVPDKEPPLKPVEVKPEEPSGEF